MTGRITVLVENTAQAFEVVVNAILAHTEIDRANNTQEENINMNMMVMKATIMVKSQKNAKKSMMIKK